MPKIYCVNLQINIAKLGKNNYMSGCKTVPPHVKFHVSSLLPKYICQKKLGEKTICYLYSTNIYEVWKTDLMTRIVVTFLFSFYEFFLLYIVLKRVLKKLKSPYLVLADFNKESGISLIYFVFFPHVML